MDKAHTTIAKQNTAGPVVRRSSLVWSTAFHAMLIACVSYSGAPAPRGETVHVSWEEVLQPESCPLVPEPDLPHEEVAEMEPPEPQPPMEKPIEEPIEEPPEEPVAKREPADWLPLERGANPPLEVWLTRLVEDKSHRASQPEVESSTVEQQPSAYVEAQPLATKNAPPSYPKAALKWGVEGTVVIELAIGIDGSVRDARVVRSSGSKLLDESARRQLGTWRFEPARRNGVAVPTRFQQPVIFRIHS